MADGGAPLIAAAQAIGLGDGPAEAEEASENQTKADRGESRSLRRRKSERVAVGQQIRVKPGDTAREVVVVLGSAVIEGTVEREVVVVCGEAFLDGKVGGDLVSIWSTVELGPNAEVLGKAVAVGKPLKLDPAAKLAVSPVEVPIGDWSIRFESFKRNVLEGVLLRPLPPHVRWAWFLAVGFFLLHLAVAVVLGAPVRACARTLVERPVRSLFAGVLVTVLSLPLMGLLSVTVIGPPLLLCTLLAAMLLGKVGVYTATGSQIGRQLRLSMLEAPLVAFLLGTLLFHVLYMVPVLGWLVWLLITTLGTGAAVLAAATALSREGRALADTPAAAPVSALLGQPGQAVTVRSVSVPDSPAAEPTIGIARGGSETAPRPVESEATLPPVLPVGGPSGLGPADLATLERAGFWPRLAAALVDVIPLAWVGATLGSFPAFIMVAVGYHAGMWVWRGATLGGVILGLRVVRLDGRRMDWPTALVRSLSSLVSLLALGLGFFWASWTEERQSWHDIVSGTTIVKLRRREPLL